MCCNGFLFLLFFSDIGAFAIHFLNFRRFQTMPSPLYSVIPTTDRKTLDTILGSIQGMNVLGSEVVTQLSNSIYFQAVYDFLVLVEGFNRTSYLDSAKKMTIGIGFNLIQAGAQEVMVNGLGFTVEEFIQMQTHEGYPLGGLSDEQIQEILKYALGCPGLPVYLVGKAQILHDRLASFKSFNLLNYQFTANQIIALQSMAFQNEDLIGTGIEGALQNMQECEAKLPPAKDCDTQPLIQIMEQSNGGKDRLNVGIQNRRLFECGLFHGNPADVHLDYRQLQKINSARPGQFTLVGPPVKWGTPAGDAEAGFTGGANIVKLPGLDPQGLDATYFGTPQMDSFSTLSGGSRVIFSGGGDDIMDGLSPMKASDTNETSAHYLAGNGGLDTYWVGKIAGHTMIYDSDNQGHLLIDGQIVVQGIAVATSTNQFTLSGDLQYTLTRTSDTSFGDIPPSPFEDSQVTLSWGDPDNDVAFANFIGGQFNLGLANLPVTYGEYPENNFVNPEPVVCGLSNGNFVWVINNGLDTLAGSICDSSGNILHTFSMSASGTLRAPVMVALNSSTFAVICIHHFVFMDTDSIGSTAEIIGQLFDSIGQPLGKYFYVTVPDYYNYWGFGLAAAILAGGNFAVSYIFHPPPAMLPIDKFYTQIFNPQGIALTGNILLCSSGILLYKQAWMTGLSNGSYLVVVSQKSGYAILNSAFLCDALGNKMGDMTLPGNANLALAPLSNGNIFLSSTYRPFSSLETSLHSVIYDQKGNMLYHGQLLYQAITANIVVAATVVANDNIMVVWSSGNRTQGQLISAENTLMGDVFNLGGGETSALATLIDYNCVLLQGFNNGNNITVTSRLFEAAALQPPANQIFFDSATQVERSRKELHRKYEDANQFTLPGDLQYTLTRTSDASFADIPPSPFEDSQVTLSWGDPDNDVTFANFIGGQFNLGLANSPVTYGEYVPGASGKAKPVVCALSNGKFAWVINNGPNMLAGSICDSSGNVLHTFSMSSSDLLRDPVIFALNNDTFGIVCGQLVNNDIIGQLFDTTGQALGNYFYVTVPDYFHYMGYGLAATALTNGNFAVSYVFHPPPLVVPKADSLHTQVFNKNGVALTKDIRLSFSGLLLYHYVGMSGLNNGNYLVVLGEKTAYGTLHTGFLCDPMGNKISEMALPGGNSDLAVTPLSNGNIFIGSTFYAPTSRETSLYGGIYNQAGHLLKGQLLYQTTTGSISVAAVTVANDNIVVVWSSGNQTQGQLLNAKNTLTGNVFTLGASGTSALATLIDCNCVLLQGFNNGNNITVTSRLFETAALQPPANQIFFDSATQVERSRKELHRKYEDSNNGGYSLGQFEWSHARENVGFPTFRLYRTYGENSSYSPWPLTPSYFDSASESSISSTALQRSPDKIYIEQSAKTFFDYGVWDDKPYNHPETGEPVFVFRVFKDGQKQEVGSAHFYAHPLICRSESGDRHNVEFYGVLTSINIDPKMLENICAVLPPTLQDKIVSSSTHAAKHGAIQGTSIVVGYAVKKTGYSADAAYYTQQAVYYCGEFAMRFYEHATTTSDLTTAASSAAMETGYLLLANTVFHAAGWAGAKAKKYAWQRTGEFLNFIGNYAGYGTYAYDALSHGKAQIAERVVMATSSVAAGTATQKGVEVLGKAGVDSVASFLSSHRATLQRQSASTYSEFSHKEKEMRYADVHELPSMRLTA
jgi:hypothetical protein